jgi:hypothetical protein
MRNPVENRPKIEIRGNDINLSESDFSKLRRVKNMLEANDMVVTIVGISTDNQTELKIAV